MSGRRRAHQGVGTAEAKAGRHKDRACSRQGTQGRGAAEWGFWGLRKDSVQKMPLEMKNGVGPL